MSSAQPEGALSDAPASRPSVNPAINQIATSLGIILPDWIRLPYADGPSKSDSKPLQGGSPTLVHDQNEHIFLDPKKPAFIRGRHFNLHLSSDTSENSPDAADSIVSEMSYFHPLFDGAGHAYFTRIDQHVNGDPTIPPPLNMSGHGNKYTPGWSLAMYRPTIERNADSLSADELREIEELHGMHEMKPYRFDIYKVGSNNHDHAYFGALPQIDKGPVDISDECRSALWILDRLKLSPTHSALVKLMRAEEIWQNELGPEFWNLCFGLNPSDMFKLRDKFEALASIGRLDVAFMYAMTVAKMIRNQQYRITYGLPEDWLSPEGVRLLKDMKRLEQDSAGGIQKDQILAHYNVMELKEETVYVLHPQQEGEDAFFTKFWGEGATVSDVIKTFQQTLDALDWDYREYKGLGLKETSLSSGSSADEEIGTPVWGPKGMPSFFESDSEAEDGRRLVEDPLQRMPGGFVSHISSSRKVSGANSSQKQGSFSIKAGNLEFTFAKGVSSGKKGHTCRVKSLLTPISEISESSASWSPPRVLLKVPDTPAIPGGFPKSPITTNDSQAEQVTSSTTTAGQKLDKGKARAYFDEDGNEIKESSESGLQPLPIEPKPSPSKHKPSLNITIPHRPASAVEAEAGPSTLKHEETAEGSTTVTKSQHVETEAATPSDAGPLQTAVSPLKTLIAYKEPVAGLAPLPTFTGQEPPKHRSDSEDHHLSEDPNLSDDRSATDGSAPSESSHKENKRPAPSDVASDSSSNPPRRAGPFLIDLPLPLSTRLLANSPLQQAWNLYYSNRPSDVVQSSTDTKEANSNDEDNAPPKSGSQAQGRAKGKARKQSKANGNKKNGVVGLGSQRSSSSASAKDAVKDAKPPVREKWLTAGFRTADEARSFLKDIKVAVEKEFAKNEWRWVWERVHLFVEDYAKGHPDREVKTRAQYKREQDEALGM